MRQDDAGVAKADERDEEAHARRNRRIKLERDGGDDELAHAQRGEQQKRNTGKEDRSQRGWPRHAHALHHRVSEIGVDPHPRRQRDRVPCQRAHQHAAHRRRQASGCGHRRQRHPGFMQNRRIDEDDVSHRHERGETGQNLRAPVRVQRCEFEVPFERRA